MLSRFTHAACSTVAGSPVYFLAGAGGGRASTTVGAACAINTGLTYFVNDGFGQRKPPQCISKPLFDGVGRQCQDTVAGATDNQHNDRGILKCVVNERGVGHRS